MVGANPRLYGGLVVHVGIVAIAVALASFSAFTVRREVSLARGGSATVSGYTVTYLGNRTTASAQKRTVSVDLRIHHGGSDLGTYAPAISTFPGANDGIGTPSVKTGLLRDVYLTLVSSPNQRGRITIGVDINAMVVWLWIGGFVIALGTLIALAPRVRRRVRPDGVPPRDAPTLEPPPTPEREVVGV
jgi:cytochrome c-type biogenesis protein CcmF